MKSRPFGYPLFSVPFNFLPILLLGCLFVLLLSSVSIGLYEFIACFGNKPFVDYMLQIPAPICSLFFHSLKWYLLMNRTSDI